MNALPPVQVSPAEWAIVTHLLRRHVPGVLVWAFGSRARHAAKPYSDLDLALIVVSRADRARTCGGGGFVMLFAQPPASSGDGNSGAPNALWAA